MLPVRGGRPAAATAFLLQPDDNIGGGTAKAAPPQATGAEYNTARSQAMIVFALE